jgi:predicted nucleic acid-binding protein
MNLFLDACIIIYLIESMEPFHSKVRTALLQIADSHSNISIVISRLSMLECLVHPLRHEENAIAEQYRTFFVRQDLRIVELAPEVVEKALWLRVRCNLRTPDALQVACALAVPGETLFLTGDKEFNKVPDLNIKII